MNRYRLLFIEGVNRDEKRWKRYPDDNWENEIPRIKNFSVGKGTRFKKKNNTLNNDTLDGTNPPKGLDPSKETSLKDKGVTDDLITHKTPVS